MKNTNVLAWSLLILLALIWGSSFILIKRGLAVFNAGEVGALRILAACLFLIPISIPKVGKLSFKHLKLLFVIGLVGSFIPAFLFAIGQTQLPSGVTGVLNALTPIFVLIMGVLFFKQEITKRKTFGLITAFVGTIVLLAAGSIGGLRGINFYALFIVLATICYGINLNVIKYYLVDLKPLVITSVSLLFMGPLAGIYLLTFTDFSVTLATEEGALEAFGYISLLGVMGTAIALILFNKLVQITNPLFTSTVTYLIPIVALIWGFWDGEDLGLGQVIGMLAIFVGVYITNRKKSISK
ncbi:permease [Roseivirga seohaensis subsp. aquiponti]|uniref:Permease n=1 Tax=Roseivirga seohaensis subsp. aquiponti TaxID=1566026 RepID=A0A0L8ANU3_9BACT|nr:DMT family transporter [Roseivirga seohaensis]KOF03916.1 permease [Roseivirga seohaensis subsp. aquiponti]